jgi:hypothetical protein
MGALACSTGWNLTDNRDPNTQEPRGWEHTALSQHLWAFHRDLAWAIRDRGWPLVGAVKTLVVAVRAHHEARPGATVAMAVRENVDSSIDAFPRRSLH